MADDRADAAVVRGVLRLGIEERRLQDGRREHDDVHRRLVVGVHGLRVHQPLAAVHGLADLGELIAVLIQADGAHVIHDAGIGPDVERRVIAPMVRVADHRRELGELLQGLGLGLLAQPVAVFDRDAIGADQVGYQLLHALLGAFGEMPAHVFLADLLAACAVDQGNRTLPAVALLLGAGQRLAEELELGLIELLAQQGCEPDQQMHARPQLEIVHIGLIPELIEPGEEARLAYVDVGEHGPHIHRLRRARGRGVIGRLPGVGPGRDVDMGEHGAQLIERGHVVGFLRIPNGHVIPMVRRDARLDVQEALRHGVGVGVMLGVAGQPQQRGDHIDVGLADRLVTVLAVVGLVGQADAALHQMQDVGIRIRGVAIDAHAEQVDLVARVERTEHADQRRLVLGAVDQGQVLADRVDARGLDGVGVQERMVQSLGFGGRTAILVLEDVADLPFGILGEFVERTVAGAVVGQPVRVDPWSVDVTEQIVGGFDDGGERRRIQSGNQCCSHGPTLSAQDDIPGRAQGVRGRSHSAHGIEISHGV